MTTQSVQVKLELGHKASLRKKPSNEGFTHDWVIFVRGPEGCNIQHFVEKVVFHLHESFPKPKRVIKEPPYRVSESGYGSFSLPIEIYFKTREEPRKIKFDYDLFLHLNGSPPVNHLRCEKLTFQNPTEEFRRKLIKAGGVGILGPNEFPGVPPSTHATTTPGTPQTSESKTFVELFGSSVQSESTEMKTQTDGKEGEHHHSKKKKSSHSKERDKDREKHKSKSSSSILNSSLAPSPVPPSSTHSTPKPTTSPGGTREKSSKDKHVSKRESSTSDHSAKKKKKDKDHERATKDRERERDKDREGREHSKERSKEHSKDRRTDEKQEKERRRDKGEKTTVSMRISQTTPEKESARKEKEKSKEREKEKSKHKDSSATSSSSKSKGHKRTHKNREKEKTKEPTKSDKDECDSTSGSPVKQKKITSSPEPVQKSQLPPMSDLFSTSDYDPFEDDEPQGAESTPPPPPPPPPPPAKTAGPDRSQTFLQSLFDEMDSEDLETSEDEDVDIESTQMAPLFAESEHSPVGSVPHTSPPQIEPAVSNGFSPVLATASELSPKSPKSSQEKKPSRKSHSSKSPLSSKRPPEKSTPHKDPSVSRRKESESKTSRKRLESSPKEPDATVTGVPQAKRKETEVITSVPQAKRKETEVITSVPQAKRKETEVITSVPQAKTKEPEVKDQTSTWITAQETNLTWGKSCDSNPTWIHSNSPDSNPAWTGSLDQNSSWMGGPQGTVLSKSNRLSPPRLGMDPPDLLKSTQHGDLLQYQASQQRIPELEKENHVDKKNIISNGNSMFKPSNISDLPEPVLQPGYAPNGETFELLLSLQEKLNTTKDEMKLSSVVRILEECGEVFSMTDSSLDFDLCYLNSATVHKLKQCLLS